MKRREERNSGVEKSIFFNMAKWEIISNNEKQQVKFDTLDELRC